MKNKVININGKLYSCGIGTINMDASRQLEVEEFIIKGIKEGKDSGSVRNLFDFEIGSWKEYVNG